MKLPSPKTTLSTLRHQSKSRSPGYPHFCLTWLQIGGSHDPSAGLILLEGLLRTKQFTCYCKFITEGNMYRQTARSREPQDKVWKCPQHSSLYPTWSWCASPPGFSESHAFGMFMEDSSHNHDKLLTHFPDLLLSLEDKRWA